MKDAKNVTITDSEWMVMRAIWTMGHATSRELIDAMNELEGWSASTTKTLLHVANAVIAGLKMFFAMAFTPFFPPAK